MSASSAPKEVLVLRLLLAVPILNLFLKEALYGAGDAKYWFIANLAMIWRCRSMPLVTRPSLCRH
ncbi:hypothetical protein [Stappia sp. BW2]|uniref:hypothetical protein n=1 Tax=Stappia sp. BW2 TaxID=2592622 RepID=UPI001AD8C19A|nr:hypothetical protein [Stappia sp. BW2]